MNHEQVDDLLVEWELGRQQGREVEASELCKDCPELEEFVLQGIQVLRRTTWMLDDPAPAPFDPVVLESVSQITLMAAGSEQVKESTQRESPGSNESEVDTDRESPKSLPDLPRIEGFRLEEEIGRGGFGIVYRALDEKLDRQVAIKIPLLNNPAQREKYMREARHAARVEVTGIVPVLQVGITESGLPFVVQKLIVGKSLAEILFAGGKLSPAQTAALIIEVCKALGTAHTRSLVHRDLKPANILIDESGKPWVTDFGLAVTEEDQADRKGEIAGTPSYMAPEQLRGKVDWFDGRTDIWAIGVIMYEALTGKLPFKALTRGELREQILNREPRPICQRMPLLPKTWDAILRRCCAKSIQDRYDSAFDLASDLLELTDSLDPASEAVGNPVLGALQRSRDPLLLADPSRAQAQVPSERISKHAFEPESSPATRSWARLGTVVLILASISVIAGIFWLVPEKPVASPTLSPVGDGQNDSTVPQAHAQMVVSLMKPAAMDRRARWFSTIQSAIDVAEDNQEIIVRPGDYRESLIISSRVALRAERNADGAGQADSTSGSARKESRVRIICAQTPAFEVSRGASLILVDIDVLPESTDAKVNTIEVHAGSLELRHCSVSAAGWACVKLEAASRLVADDCTFTARDAPAIAAKGAEEFNMRKCSFELLDADSDSASGVEPTQAAISSPNESTSEAFSDRIPDLADFSQGKDDDRSREIRVMGVQAIGMPGTLTECAFQGPTAVGVNWKETVGIVSLDNCEFRNLFAGVVARSCLQLNINGRSGVTQFSNCRMAIKWNFCNGSIRNCQFEFTADPSQSPGTFGIQILGRAALTGQSGSPASLIDACKFNGFDRAMLIAQTSVRASDISILDSDRCGICVGGNADLTLTGPTSVIRNSSIGLLVESGYATLRRCRIEECSTAGIVADGQEDVLVAEGCTFYRNNVGVALLSGSASFTSPEIDGSQTGILVSRKFDLYKYAAQNDAPLALAITYGGHIASSLHAIHFLSPGSYQLDGCELDDGHGTPFLGSGLTEDRRDNVVTVRQIRE